MFGQLLAPRSATDTPPRPAPPALRVRSQPLSSLVIAGDSRFLKHRDDAVYAIELRLIEVDRVHLEVKALFEERECIDHVERGETPGEDQRILVRQGGVILVL